MTRDPVWDALKAHSKEKFNTDRKRFLEQAVENDDGEWTKHTDYHWSRMVNDHRLDYWPSRKKFQFKGKVRRGDVYSLIRKEME